MRSSFSCTRAALLAVLFALSLAPLLGGCADKSAPSVLLALDGPPLFAAAAGETLVLSGSMDRSCMAGIGDLLLAGKNTELSCRGSMDHPANSKGRMYIDLACSDGTALTFVMRNLGPDQGMGVGEFTGNGETVILFYHPCENEAFRRLQSLREDLAAALEKKKKREE